MSGWQSTREKEPSEGRENLSRALQNGIKGVGEQISEINRSDRGRLLLIGDYLLQALETLPGRTILAVVSLWGAWVLLH